MIANWMGYAMSSCWICGIIIAVIGPYCLTYLNRWTFFLFMIFTGLSCPFYYFFVPETQNKTPESIRKNFESTQGTPVVTTEAFTTERGDSSPRKTIENNNNA